MKRKNIIWISIIAIVVIIGIVIAANYQEIFRSITPVKPIIVSSQADGSSSTLFEYSVKVTGEIVNRGGDGSVVVEATLFQGENQWTKTKELYMTSYETSSFEIIFDEAKLLDAEPEYKVTAFPLGSLN